MAAIESFELDAAYTGTARRLVAFRYGTLGARPKAYIQAALHAGEMTGVVAIHYLRLLLDAEAAAGNITGEVVLVPMANPIGLGQFHAGDHAGRFEALSLENFNRGHFDLTDAVHAAVAGRLGGSAPENVALVREAAVAAAARAQGVDEWASLRRLLLGLSVDADVVLDLHSDMAAAMFMYTNAIDGDAARMLAAQIGCEAVVDLDPYVPSRTFCGVVGGLFPRLAERAGPGVALPQSCFAAMIEMRGRHDCTEALARADAANLLAYLRRLGIVAGDPGPLPAMRCAITPVEGMDVGYAPVPGFTLYAVAPGARVREGEVVCTVLDPTAADPAAAAHPVRARTDGVVYARSLAGMYVTPGKVLFRIAGAEPLAHRKGRSWLDD